MQVVTLYGYDSHDYVQPSTYPVESVTPQNVDIDITESVVDGQKVGTFSASLEGTNVDNPDDLGALSFQQVSLNPSLNTSPSPSPNPSPSPGPGPGPGPGPSPSLPCLPSA